MRNGLYKAAFAGAAGSGTGVVVLTDGVFRGGDATMYYLGTYKESGDSFTAELNVNRHSPGGLNVFGKDQVSITVAGTTSGDSANLKAQGAPFSATLTRIAD